MNRLSSKFVKEYIENSGDELIKPYKKAKKRLHICCQFCKCVYRPLWNNYYRRNSRCKCQMGSKINANRALTQEEFIKKCKEIHIHNNYNYSNTIFTKISESIKFVCNIHGEITINRAGNHIYPSGNSKKPQGCSKCGKEKSAHAQFKLWDKSQFLEIAKKLHPNLIYSNDFVYNGVHNHISAICPVHGKFAQLGYHHIRRKDPRGCPSCHESKGEQYIRNLLINLDISFVSQMKMKINNQRWDFYLQNSDIYVEFQGQQHFEIVEFFGGMRGFCDTVSRDLVKINWILNNQNILLSFCNINEVEKYKDYFNSNKNREYLLHKTKKMIWNHCEKLYNYLESLDEEIETFPYDELDNIYINIRHYMNNSKTEIK
jgi:hypothetical protein